VISDTLKVYYDELGKINHRENSAAGKSFEQVQAIVKISQFYNLVKQDDKGSKINDCLKMLQDLVFLPFKKDVDSAIEFVF